MQVLVDNKDILSTWGIHVLDWTEAFGIAAERDNFRTWEDKSGTDESLVNRRYESREFSMSYYFKTTDAIEARMALAAFTSYLFSKTNVVLSFRHSSGKRFAILCHRSTAVTANGLHLYAQGAQFVFDLPLREVNPNAVKYYTSVQNGLITIAYSKGKNAVIYWGDGTRGTVSNSQTYTSASTLPDGAPIEVIVDVDNDADAVASLVCDFSANIPTGIVPEEVQFTNLSTGGAVLWSWDFGDGSASIEQHPKHTYTTDGVFTVKLQIFNSQQGTAIMVKSNLITLRRGRRLKDSSGGFRLINGTNYRLKN